MKDKIKFAIVVALLGAAVLAMPAIGQEDPYTCIDRHPNGVEVWGCYQGEPYWDIAQYAGEVPMVSAGTLYMPSKAKRPMNMGERIVDNAITSFKWKVEAEANRKIDRAIYDMF